jgi:thiol-disulfide isomerase/thioredoxin
MLRTALVLLLLAGTALHAGAKDASPGEQLRDLQNEYDIAFRLYLKSRQDAATPEEKDKLYQQWRPQFEDFCRQFLAIAEKDPKDPAAVDALVWVVQNAAGAPPDRDHSRDRAIDLLVRDDVKSEALAPLVPRLGWEIDRGTEKLLAALIKDNPHRQIQGQAVLSLGESRRQMLRARERIKQDPDQRKEYEQTLGKDAVDDLLARNDKDLTKETVKLFERVVKEYGDDRDRSRREPTTLGQRAERYLFELTHLAVGQEAPELESTDLEGKAVRLSGLRGKVVVLDVWATWCGPCVEMIPRQRELVKRLEGKPFVLVSVSVDEEKDDLVKFLKKQPMPWTHWHNGPTGGVIDAWNVTSYPTIYVLDARGVIRFKDVRDKALGEAVEALVKEAEADAKKPK